MAGKPNPLLSRHKKHRGADLTVSALIIVMKSAVCFAYNINHCSLYEHLYEFNQYEMSTLWYISILWSKDLLNITCHVPISNESIICASSFCLFLVFFDLLQGSYQSVGGRAVAQSIGCCCSNGCRSILWPAGSTSSSPCTPPTSPFARPASQPCYPETSPGAHPHHTRSNPLFSLLTHQPLTADGQKQPLEKAHCEDTNNKQQLIGEKIQPWYDLTERAARGGFVSFFSLYLNSPSIIKTSKQFTNGMSRGEMSIMHWTPLYISHLPVWWACQVTTIAMEDPNADLFPNVKPHLVLHNTSGPDSFSAVVMARCCLILCTSKDTNVTSVV